VDQVTQWILSALGNTAGQLLAGAVMTVCAVFANVLSRRQRRSVRRSSQSSQTIGVSPTRLWREMHAGAPPPVVPAARHTSEDTWPRRTEIREFEGYKQEITFRGNGFDRVAGDCECIVVMPDGSEYRAKGRRDFDLCGSIWTVIYPDDFDAPPMRGMHKVRWMQSSMSSLHPRVASTDSFLVNV
jgi:hypothetical protein